MVVFDPYPDELSLAMALLFSSEATPCFFGFERKLEGTPKSVLGVPYKQTRPTSYPLSTNFAIWLQSLCRCWTAYDGRSLLLRVPGYPFWMALWGETKSLGLLDSFGLLRHEQIPISNCQTLRPIVLGVPSPFFPGILSRKPPETLGKRPMFEKKNG